MPVTPDLRDRFLLGLGDAAVRPLGLAVSGGGDSMAMLHLAHRAGLAVKVATVDHGLRPDSAAEAAGVAGVCAALGLPHAVLRWQGWDGRGNLQDRARQARRQLLAAWAQKVGVAGVALAHTADDLAETLLMRLARGAGVDGLAAMAGHWPEGGTQWHRPLLTVGRDELRAWLAGIGAVWVEDPSNRALRFDRVRVRQALPQLAEIGLTVPVLAGVARHLAEARAALEAGTDAAARRLLSVRAGVVRIAAELMAEPEEIRRRLLLRVILWVAPAPYPPRGAAVQAMLARMASGKSAQLAGCHLLPVAGGWLAFREARAVAGLVASPGALWDGVWRISGPFAAGQELRALAAAGLAQWPHWRETGLPRAALISQPAVWQGDRLIAVPALQTADHAPSGWQAEHEPRLSLLHLSALSH